jgi:glycine cleavage system H protein
MSIHTPENLKYTKEHEWIEINDDAAVIGITDFAQSSLGDIVYLELPEVGTKVEQNAAFGVVESIKSVSDLYAPVSGEILEINEDLAQTPEEINKNAYSSWIIKIKFSNKDEVESLLSAQDYAKLCN